MSTPSWLAVDIGGTMIKHGRFSGAAELLSQEEIPTKAQEGAEALLSRVLGICLSQGELHGVGISTAGQVDPTTGRILFATDALPGWQGMQLAERLQNALNLCVAVENDGNAAAIGEAFYGAGRGEEHLLCLTYGTGIGGGLMLGGRLYRGAGFMAGECGHITIMAGGRDCACGGKGCYEAYASASALLLDVRKAFGEKAELPAFFDALKAGAQAERRVYEAWLECVIAGLASLTHVLNPGAIILGGGVMQRQPMIPRDIAAKLPGRVMQSYAGIKVKAAALGNNAGLYGAYHLAREEAKKHG